LIFGFVVAIGQASSAMVILTVGIFLIHFLRTVQKRMKEAISENDRNKLLKAIKFHNRVIELCENLNQTFALVVFSKYFFMAFLICLLGFQLVMVCT
jgi:ABC-type polysaccharide/polyol phosphate export permease